MTPTPNFIVPMNVDDDTKAKENGTATAAAPLQTPPSVSYPLSICHRVVLTKVKK